MNYSVSECEPVVPCAPLFVETADGFALTDEATALLAAMDPPDVPSSDPTPLQRLASIRAEFAALVGELPAAARSMGSCELLDAVEVLQQCVNVAAACDQAVLAELDRNDVHTAAGATSTADLLVQYLHVRPAEAARRVRSARACAERMSLDGQALPPLRPHIAAAQAAGTVSADHALVVDRAINRLPSGLDPAEVDELERVLTDLAGQVDPGAVVEAGRRMNDLYDPDGPEPRDARQRRLRSVRLYQRDDGTGRLVGELTPGLLAKLQAVLSPLAAPRPADAHGDDPRAADVRLHDAVEEVCDRLLRSGTLPDTGGVPATVAVTISHSQLLGQVGRVRTDLGADLSVPQLLHLACEAEIIPVVLNDAGGIMSHGRSKRFATAAQTKALRARDRGCTFPGCRRPPEWCERHHVVQWLRDHGDTDIDDLCLLCSYHHHQFEGWGWDVVMRDGVPWWTPPAHLDPERRPIRNDARHAEIVFAAV